MRHELIIDGNNFSDLNGFVDEVRRACLAKFGGSPWEGDIHRFAEFLEAQAEAAGGQIILRWIHSSKSSADLGFDQMAEFWLRHISEIEASASRSGYEPVYGNSPERLAQARAGVGMTLFEWLVWQLRGESTDTTGEHGLVELRLE